MGQCMRCQCCSPWALCVQPAEASFTITYKRGIVEGQVGADTLSITDGPIVISNQTFGLATSSTLDFTRAACDGIFVRPLRPIECCDGVMECAARHRSTAFYP